MICPECDSIIKMKSKSKFDNQKIFLFFGVMLNSIDGQALRPQGGIGGGKMVDKEFPPKMARKH